MTQPQSESQSEIESQSPLHTCTQCGSTFTPQRKQVRRFCSRPCAVRWHNAKRPRSGVRPGRKRLPIADRLAAHITRASASECWPWIGDHTRWGYGVVPIVKNGKRHKVAAHRLAWEEVNGPIPEGLYVCHRCDNPPCCNPSHLFLGTAADNNADRDAKSRGVFPVGTASGVARFTEDEIREIRAMAAAGVTRRDIAAAFDTAHTTINAIVTRRTWRHVA